MVDQLLEEFEHDITNLTLIPSKGGLYEVVIDGDLIYSKKATGEHADYEDVAPKIRERL
jgi:selenoprotein W-related protein